MLVNAANLKTLFTGFKGAFNKGFESAPSFYERVAMIVPSQVREEEYGWLGQLPQVREWIGPRVVQNLTAHSYVIKNRAFELTVSVRRDDISDDQYGIYAPMFGELGKAAGELPDQLVFGLLNNGFTGTCYDGQYFFNTDHPVKTAAGAVASVSNTQGGSGEGWFLLDTSRQVRPLIFQERSSIGQLVKKDLPGEDNVFFDKEFIYGTDGRCNAGYGLWQLAYASKQPLNAANYEAARAAMMNQRGDEGRPLNIKPDVLVCGPNNEGAAMRLLNNGTRVEVVTTGAGEDAVDTPVSIQNEWAKTAEPIVTQWLA